MSEAKRRGRLAEFLIRLVKEKPVGVLCGMIVLLLIFVTIFADVLAPYEYYKMHLLDRLKGSSAQYPLGTDHLGRDLLSRLIYGARISLLVGLAATTLNWDSGYPLRFPAGERCSARKDVSTWRWPPGWLSGLVLP